MSLAFCNTDSISQIASAIRLKGGTSASMSFPAGFVSAISNIETGMTIDDFATNNYDYYLHIDRASFIASWAFVSNSKIAHLYASSCKVVYREAFCFAKLYRISFPECSTFDYRCFSACSYMTIAYVPEAKYIGMAAFTGCYRLNDVTLQNAIRLESYALAVCTSLTSVRLNNIEDLYSGAFYNCNSLARVEILSSSVCYLQDSTVFTNTPMKNSSYLGFFGSIYVPSSMVNAYKTTTNWTLLSSRITSI